MEEYPKSNPLEKKHWCPKCQKHYSDVEIIFTPFGWDCRECRHRSWSFSERKRDESQGVAGEILIEKKQKKNGKSYIHHLFREFADLSGRTPEEVKANTKKLFGVESLKELSEETLKEMEGFLEKQINNIVFPI